MSSAMHPRSNGMNPFRVFSQAQHSDRQPLTNLKLTYTLGSTLSNTYVSFYRRPLRKEMGDFYL